MSTRLRLVLLGVIVVAVVLSAGGYVWHVRQDQAAALASATPVGQRDDLAALRTQPHLIFRNTALGQGFGKVAVVPLTDPGGPRALTPVDCERVHATAADTICLSADRGLVTTYRAQLLDSLLQPTRDLPLTGLPSRTRLSRDGSLVATTTFVYGDSYANPGQFSTRTVVTRTDGAVAGDIEQFKLTVDGKVVTAADKNLWGVTFADDDRFYATAASGGRTWLVEGSLRTRTVNAIRGDVECPSLSPDKTRIAFKKHGTLPAGRWHLAVYNLRTGTETPAAEPRSVDDQVEWLDDETLTYGLPRTAPNGASTSDIWQIPADGTGAPRVLVSDAWSPAVIR